MVHKLSPATTVCTRSGRAVGGAACGFFVVAVGVGAVVGGTGRDAAGAGARTTGWSPAGETSARGGAGLGAATAAVAGSAVATTSDVANDASTMRRMNRGDGT